MEKIGYFFLGTAVVIWAFLIFSKVILSLPVGIVGLLAIIGFGLLLIKIIGDRVGNKEDEYYDKNIER